MIAVAPQSLRRYLMTAIKLTIFGSILVVVAAVSAYLTVRRAVSGRDVLVPDLVMMDETEAESVLKKQGLLIERVAERHDPRVASGMILAQEPVAGSSIKIDRKVKVVISLGDKGGAIPELRGSAARSAQISLQQMGLKMTRQAFAYSQRESENLVMAQDPLAGEFGLKEGQVSLLISRGRRPATFVMPDLTGRTQEEVLRFLTRAGLRPGPVRRDSDAGAGRPGEVLAHRPEAGYPVRSGDLISLTVSGAGSQGDDD